MEIRILFKLLVLGNILVEIKLNNLSLIALFVFGIINIYSKTIS